MTEATLKDTLADSGRAAHAAVTMSLLWSKALTACPSAAAPIENSPAPQPISNPDPAGSAAKKSRASRRRSCNSLASKEVGSFR